MMNATSPTEIAATYDLWAIDHFESSGSGCVAFGQPGWLDDQDQPRNPPIRVYVRLVKYRVRADGISEESPLAADRWSGTIDDLYAAAATEPAFATALEALTVAVAGYATARGAL